MKYIVFTAAFLFGLLALGALFSKAGRRKLSGELMSRDAASVMKGIAMVAVMVGHVGNLFGVRYLTPLGSLGVGVFLFCSGFGLQRSSDRSGLHRFWRKRIVGVYIPYVLVELVYYVLWFEELTPSGVLWDLLLIYPLHPLGWYMKCLFLYYAAFYVGTVLRRYCKSLQVLVPAALGVSMFFFMDGLYKEQLFTFTLGVLAAHRQQLLQWLERRWALPAAVLAGCGALAVKQLSVVREAAWFVLYGVRAVQTLGLSLAVVCAATILVRLLPARLTAPVKAAGAISYELYLLHMFFMPKQISYVGIAIFFVASFAAAMIYYHVNKRAITPAFGRLLRMT